MISIEIPTMGEPALELVLESIRGQSYQDYEVLVLDSSDGFVASDVAEGYGCRVIRKRVGLFMARHILHLAAKGGTALLLDSTRVMRRDCLLLLSDRPEDMVVVGEREVGHGALAAAIDADRARALNGADPVLPPHKLASFVLPRYFSSGLLGEAFSAVRGRMGMDVERVIGEDHKVVFLEAGSRSRRIGIISEPLIFHMGRDGPVSIFLKSLRYGSSYSVVRKWYPEAGIRSRRDLSGLDVRTKSSLLLLYMIQAAGFYTSWAVSLTGYDLYRSLHRRYHEMD